MVPRHLLRQNGEVSKRPPAQTAVDPPTALKPNDSVYEAHELKFELELSDPARKENNSQTKLIGILRAVLSQGPPPN